MFVTTANTLNILPPLLDRMEVIRIPGYTEDEKINIANKYLLPKALKENGVKEGEMNLVDGTIKEIIRPSENLLEFAAGQFNDPKYKLGEHEWPALKRMLNQNNSIYDQ